MSYIHDGQTRKDFRNLENENEKFYDVDKSYLIFNLYL
jgi:hypothetical protein